MAIEPFQLARYIDQFGHLLVLVTFTFQILFAFKRLVQGHGIGRIARHQFGDAIHLAIRHAHDSPDIPQCRPGLQGSKCNDLGDFIHTVFVLNISDHFITAVLTEINIEVRHRHTLRIEETFKQQPPTDRIKIRDQKRISHQ